MTQSGHCQRAGWLPTIDVAPGENRTERALDMPLFNIGFVIFPDLTQLDFTGPLQILSRLPQSATHIVEVGDARS
jgi:hypothetical protein